ncbi:E2-like enzyme [Basidiobolus ranarum]|uniref:Autophagy-related protein 3 n=1 Tax=Basidiobolus ranarum TaxID=34480 RepID=A0ABR2VY90_9FUNG
MHSVQSLFFDLREYLNPVLKNSRFKETGVLTPEEFVAAGDFLVYKCPTWSWASGIESKRREYLPEDKQYLVTRNVPCLKRVKQMEYSEEGNEEVEADGEDGWVATHSNRVGDKEEDIQEIEGLDTEEEEAIQKVAELTLQEQEESAVPENLDEIPDMDDDFEEILEDEDPAAYVQTGDENNDNILKTRTYDLSITYDKYYQTPRVWLFGYDENRNPLTTDQVFEDISQDHAKKTVTIETHPHENLQLASIHPCRHANVMKKILERLSESGREELRVDQYMIIFLKFISSVLPTIDYDYTISMSG